MIKYWYYTRIMKKNDEKHPSKNETNKIHIDWRKRFKLSLVRHPIDYTYKKWHPTIREKTTIFTPPQKKNNKRELLSVKINWRELVSTIRPFSREYLTRLDALKRWKALSPSHNWIFTFLLRHLADAFEPRKPPRPQRLRYSGPLFIKRPN